MIFEMLVVHLKNYNKKIGIPWRNYIIQIKSIFEFLHSPSENVIFNTLESC